MKDKPIFYGLLLTAVTLLLFFCIYYFFIGFNYYIISLIVNAFVLPILYTIIPIILLYRISCRKNLSFQNCFQYSFITMFIGGTISFLFITFFFNFIDKDAHYLLQHQRIEINIKNVQKEYKSIKEPTQDKTDEYNKIIKALSTKETKQEAPFNFKRSFYFLSTLYIFYTIISLFLSIFFKNQKKHATLNSHSFIK